MNRRIEEQSYKGMEGSGRNKAIKGWRASSSHSLHSPSEQVAKLTVLLLLLRESLAWQV